MGREPLTLPRTADVRRLLVAEEDVAAARRLLSVLAPSGADHGEEQERRPDAQEVRQRAHIELALRQRRMQIFEESLATEVAFALLLALYVAEGHEPIANMTRLSKLAAVQLTTTQRWVGFLIQKGLIKRAKPGKDRRKAVLSLTAEARSKLDELFSWTE